MAMLSLSSSAVAVDKATSDLLIGPDWTMNMDICDSVNSHRWQSKDVMKAVKKRLLHKSPKVQLLALTLLETMVKNCGDDIHYQIVEKNILTEMVKIVRKKTDTQVRDKTLILLDSWQEAFGGPGARHSQYYWAYEELRRSGVGFPPRSKDAVPILTPPVTHPPLRHAQAGYGMPRNSSRTLDETMASEVEGLSLSNLDSMRDIMDLLGDMLEAVDAGDREAVKDEVIVDLVNQCRTNQKILMQMLTTTGDEELLGRGLELNDGLQIVLSKHDAIASGSVLPSRVASSSPKKIEGSKKTEGSSSTDVKPTEVRDGSPSSISGPTELSVTATRNQVDEEEEEEDDFAQLARRHSKTQASSSQSTSGSNGNLEPVDTNALALVDPSAPVRTTNEQDFIDLLTITLSTASTSSHPDTPPLSSQSMPPPPISSGEQGNPYAPHAFPENQGQVPYSSYVVPWAQTQPHPPFQPQSQPLSHQQLPSQPQQHAQPYPQQQPQLHSQYPQYSYGYPPPPWAATPGYSQGYTPANNMLSNAQSNLTTSHTPTHALTPFQHHNSFPAKGSSVSAVNDPWSSSKPRIPAPGGEKPFVPSYRLFEDLNVLSNADGRFKMNGGTQPSLTGASGQSMVGGRK